MKTTTQESAFDLVIAIIPIVRLARHFGITPAAVSQWRATGIPPTRAPKIEKILAGAVTKEEMCPGFPWV